MKRTNRAQLAQETLAICEQGYYASPDGRRVNIAGEIARAKAGTVIYSPERPPAAVACRTAGTTRFDVRNDLVLGAWGCGVFRNEPKMVAATFAALLLSPGEFAGVFRQVVFAVYDRAEDKSTYRAFAERFEGGLR